MDFKKRLKELRKKKNVTQKEVGFILGYNCSAISNYECGKNEPSIRDIILLAKYFNVSVDYLVGATDTIFNQKTTTETILQLFSIIYNNFPEDIQKYIQFLIKEIFLQYCCKKK